MLEGIPIEKVTYLAFKTSTGAVSDYLKVNRRAEWDALKAELAKRFADISDAQHAFTLLRQVKQERNERVQVYAERLLSLAEQAYEGAQDAQVTESHLIGFFTDGLYSDRLKIKVMRDDPKTLREAINSARDEFKLQQRFQLRMGRHYFAPLCNIGDPMVIIDIKE
jgi:predicted DsbA family dithiol-disulfide isomerase